MQLEKELKKTLMTYLVSYLGLYACMIIISYLLSYKYYEILAENTTSLASNSILSNDKRQMLFYLNTAALNFRAVMFIDHSNSLQFVLPTTFAPKNTAVFLIPLKNPIITADGQLGEPSSSITYYFDFSRIILFTTGIWLLLIFFSIPLFLFSRKSLEKKYQDDLAVSQLKLSNILAQQVAHDIRSPLSALTMMSDAFNSVPEEKRLIIRGAIQRINDIANDLLQKSKENTSAALNNITTAQQTKTQQQNSTDTGDINKNLKTQIELLPAVVDLIISEKRIQYRDKMNVEITSDFSHSYGEFAEINANELKRVLSNLINNSVEAFAQQTGKIIVSIQNDQTSDQSSGQNNNQSSDQNNVQSTVSIVVRDNGKGIPPQILTKLGEKGISHGKEGTASGSGLGIYHAKNAIESFNGKFEVLSRMGMGTTITMSFPKAAAPSWFVEKLFLPSGSQVVSLDDDLSIHQIWKGRLQSLNAESAGVGLLSFTSGNEFKNYIVSQNTTSNSSLSQTSDHAQKTYLIDFELLNQNMTGLDLIEELGLGDYPANPAILVTSRYEEEHIQNRCAKLGVKLIPKGMAGFVPIEITESKIKYDAVLIDDDALIHMTWQIVAKEKNKTVKLFKTEAEFLAVASRLETSTPIYVDVNLAQGVNGIEVAERLYKLGFLKLYLATGYSEIDKPDFITAVVGKDPQI